MSKGNYWIKKAARQVVFLCNDKADDGMIPRAFEVEELIQEAFEERRKES